MAGTIQLHSRVLIGVPPEQTWFELMALHKWSEWNTFIFQMKQVKSGELEVGSEVEVSELHAVLCDDRAKMNTTFVAGRLSRVREIDRFVFSSVRSLARAFHSLCMYVCMYVCMCLQ